jgi:8-oxo-dGTP diphosphatase
MQVRTRAGVVILQADEIAVIERRRDGRLYYVLPGGGVEPGESIEQAAIREAAEELGVRVVLRGLVATVELAGPDRDSRQHYFAAEIVEGEFGSGEGLEFAEDRDLAAGTYRSTWLSLDDASSRTVHPRALLEALRHKGVEDLLRMPLRAVETASDPR